MQTQTMTRPQLPRPIMALLALALALLTVGLPLSRPAEAFTSVRGVRLNNVEARLLQRINAARAARGISALRVVPGYTDVARRWAYHQAQTQRMEHNPNMVRQLTRSGGSEWRTLGENVGTGFDADSLFEAYWNSPPHRANLLNRAFHYIGIGWVERPDGRGFNTQNFVSDYSTSYGRTRVPAFGGRHDSVTLSTTTTIGSFESGTDARLMGSATSGLSSRVSVERPVAGVDNAARFTVRETRSGTGGRAGMMMRDSVQLRFARSVTMRVRAKSATGRPVVVQVSVRTGFGTSVSLGRVTVASGTTRVVTLPLPEAARAWRNHIFVAVPRYALRALSSSRTLRVATVSVYQMDVNV